MVPHLAPQSPASTSAPLPPLTRSTTLPARPVTSDRSLLTPEDAIYQLSPPQRQSHAGSSAQKDLHLANGLSTDAARVPRRARHKDRNHSGSRRRKGPWKKLLYVKQSYPDNYTDQNTFLEHLQRNPRLKPYDFWPLVANSQVIVQHVCSVIIFNVCFVGIFQDRISPVAVMGWGSFATVLGWVLWDWWVGQEPATKGSAPPTLTQDPPVSAASSTSNLGNISTNSLPGQYLGISPHSHSHSASASSIQSNTSASHVQMPSQGSGLSFPPPRSHRTSLRLSTAKSALIIYFTLLGLSPILKSLTRSTSSDSIWAIAISLFTMNIFFFNYGTPSVSSSTNSYNNHIPASLSTNAALMASTVLASRLPMTGQVFSLTLFSIEVFGLFPVFRGYTRQYSWRGHVTLTILLVVGAGGGVGLILGHGGDGNGFWDFPWKSGILGAVIGVLITGLVMGGCSWWLIGLQKYKNEIHGPWDPARPVITRQWDEY